MIVPAGNALLLYALLTADFLSADMRFKKKLIA
jgi:hypothetical protein